MKKTNRTYIGGQAVVSGVMMRGKRGMATVVRDDKGELHTEAKRITPPEKRSVFTRIPFVRGIVNFVSTLVVGMGTMLRSSEVAFSEEETPSKFSKWLEEKWNASTGDLLTALAAIAGIVIALALFLFLPGLFTRLIAGAVPAVADRGKIWYSLIEGGFRLVIFILYIVFTLLLPSMRDTYRYHGAEHKTINCYECGLPLTKENVKKCSRLHDRCGTTFIFIVMIVSILMFALANWVLFGVLQFNPSSQFLSNAVSYLIKLALLPVVAGISYELLKFFALFQGPLVVLFKVPGYLLQKLTTKEPDEEMIECAILAFEKVLDMDANPDSPEKMFATSGKLSKLAETMKKHFAEKGIDESDAEWILSLTLNIPRSALGTERHISQAACKQILSVYEQRLTGRPLWYIYGNTEFYGYQFKVDERVLIPRPETEILVRQAVSALKDGDAVLDLCTGSGAVAVSVACEAAKDKNVSVTATDISAEALEIARENARVNKANVTFLKSDLFEKVRGRFELITANPPYVKSGEIGTLPKDVREFEPHLALDGGVDGLDFYRRIAQKINRYIARGGLCILEVGEDQAQDVIRIFRENSRCDFAMVVKDLNGVERVVKIGF